MLVLLMLYTGLRFGEATALEWRLWSAAPISTVLSAAARRCASSSGSKTLTGTGRKIVPGAKTPGSIRLIAVQP